MYCETRVYINKVLKKKSYLGIFETSKIQNLKFFEMSNVIFSPFSPVLCLNVFGFSCSRSEVEITGLLLWRACAVFGAAGYSLISVNDWLALLGLSSLNAD